MSPCPDRRPTPDRGASSRRNDLGSPPASATDTDPVRVLLIDDHRVMLLGMTALCADEPDLVVVGTATSEDEARRAHRHLHPDVVVLPIRLDGTRKGIEIARWIKSRSATRVVFFTAFARPVDAVLATLAGADALVPRTAPAAELAAAIRAEDTELHSDGPADVLTPREQDILQLALEGLTNPEIATRLQLALPTVKTHMRHVLRKLDVADRRELF